MTVHRYLVTAEPGPKMDMWAATGAVANWITGRDNPHGAETETWLVTVCAEHSDAFLTAARSTGVTVEEIQGSDDTEQYLLRVGEPGTGWQAGTPQDVTKAEHAAAAVDDAEADRLSQLADCPTSRHNGLHCLHYQEGDGPCCDCNRANWCPAGGVR